MGPPFEPNPWECSDDDDEEFDCMLQATQEIVDSLDNPPKKIKFIKGPGTSVQHWSSPKDQEKLDAIRKERVPETTKKQMQWALSIWNKRALCYKKHIAKCACMSTILMNNSQLGLIAFWLPSRCTKR